MPDRAGNFAVMMASEYVGHVTWKEQGQVYEFQMKYGAVRHFPNLDRLRAELSGVFNPQCICLYAQCRALYLGIRGIQGF